jgi:predicted permease
MLGALFKRQSLEDRMDQEMQFHLESLTEDLVRSGVPRREAERRARLEFGGVEVIQEQCREAKGVRGFDQLRQDINYAFRVLRRNPGFGIVSALTLALGIGANTALFTLFNSVVLRPLPVPDPSRVVAVYRTTPQIPFGPFSFPDYIYYRDHNIAFAGVASLFVAHLRMSGAALALADTQSSGHPSFAGVSGPEQLPGAAESVMGLFVSANYFSVMKVNPVLGRGFLPDDEGSSGPPYAVLLSENFWRRRFDRDPNILGKNLMFSGISATVVGITPQDFMGERPEVPDVWLPIAAQQDPQRRLQDHSSLCCLIEARLKPGVTLQQAQAEVSVLASAIKKENPDTDQQAGINVRPATPFGANQRGYQIIYAILQPAIGMVLLIACANVAGLLLGRAASRQREIAIRRALGASRGRLIRQLVTEGVLVAQLAGGVSLLVTWLTLDVLVKVMSSSLASSGLGEGGTIFLNVTPDVRVFLYTFCIAFLTGVAFALAPALQATKPDLTSALKGEGAVFGVSRKSRFRGWLVATQIAICLMLLIGAGMLVRSSMRLLSTDPGFETSTVLNVSILNPRELGYSASRAEELRQLLQERLRALPGVKSVADASRVPLGGNVTSAIVVRQGSQIAGDTRVSDQAPQFPYSFISPEYFETLGISLLRGRTISPQEIASHAPVAIVSNALARRLWPGEDAIGKRITIGSPSQTHFQFQQAAFSESSEVIGIARDVYSVTPISPDPGALYLPQLTGQWNHNLLVRTKGDPRRVAASLVSEVRALDHNLSVSFQTLDQMMASEPYFIITRLGGIVFAVIGLLGLILASIGIYSMVGYTVSQQTHEIGIHMALGAQRSDVLRLVIGRSLWSIIAGIGVGIALGIILSRALSALFQGLRLLDPTVLFGVSLLLTAVALIAAYIPARRATKVDPMIALRYE